MLILRIKGERGIRTTPRCQGASPDRELTPPTSPLLRRENDKDPAQPVHPLSLCQFPALLVHAAEPVQWDPWWFWFYSQRWSRVEQPLPHPAFCLSSHLLGPHLPGSPQQRLGWIWYQIGPVSVPAPGSSLYQLGFHWQQTPPSVHLDRQCIPGLLGPKQTEDYKFRAWAEEESSKWVQDWWAEHSPSPFLKQWVAILSLLDSLCYQLQPRLGTLIFTTLVLYLL